MTIVRSVEKKCRNIKYQNLNNLNSWTFAPELRKKKKKGSRKWGREYHNKKAVEQLETNLGNLTVSVQMHAPSLQDQLVLPDKNWLSMVKALYTRLYITRKTHSYKNGYWIKMYCNLTHWLMSSPESLLKEHNPQEIPVAKELAN